MTAVTAAPATLRLALRPPFDGAGVLRWLAARLVPGVEALSDGVYRRTLDLPGGPGVVTLAPAADHVEAVFALDDAADLPAAEARCRHLLDLDADPAAPRRPSSPPTRCSRRWSPRARASAPPAPSTRPRPRCAPSWASRSRSRPRARSRAGSSRRADRRSPPPGTPDPSLPGPAAIADETVLAAVGCRARAGGRCWRCAPAWPRADLSPRPGPRIPAQSGRSNCSRARLGPWTADYVLLRALGDPDAFPAGDLGLRRAARALGLPDDAAGLEARAERWRPWRRYAAHHLWAAGHEVRPRRHADRDADPGRDRRRPARDPVRRPAPPDGAEAPGDRVLADAARQLREWFAGERTAFDLPLDLGAATAFQRRAWLALAEVPYATTRSYGEQAAGSARRARARSARERPQPAAGRPPVHRLVGADGSLTGFGGGLDVKRALLDHEAATAARAAAAGSARTRRSPAPPPRTSRPRAPQSGHGSPRRRWTRNSSWNAPRDAVGVAEVVDRRAARGDPRLERVAHGAGERVVLRARQRPRPAAAGGSARGTAPRRRRCSRRRRPGAGRAGTP